MRKFMGCFILLAVVLAMGVSENTSAITNNLWTHTSAVKVGEVPTKSITYDAMLCAGVMMPIETTTSDGAIEACVFGEPDGARLARLRGAASQFIYAFAYSGDTTFSVIRDFCVGVPYCGYGQAEDVALVQGPLSTNWRVYGHSLVRDFSARLTRYALDSRYLQYVPDGPLLRVQNETTEFITGAIAVSPGGKWVVVELHDYGFIRINLHTLRMQRIAAPGARYNLGADPTFEIAITDDGSKVAVTGHNAGIDIYEVTDNCGDDVGTELMGWYFSSYVMPCGRGSVDRYALIPGFIEGHAPHFSADGSRLSVHASRALLGDSIVTFAPGTSGGADSASEYRAFGDSFTSGEGETDDRYYVAASNTVTNRCHISTRSYPFLIGKWWELPTQSYACSGSTISDVRIASDKSLREVMSKGSAPRVVSLGVGGNDVDLVGKLKTCLSIGTCEWARQERRLSTANEIRAIFPKITALIDKLKNDYSQAPIVLVGYPRVINPDSSACDAFVSVALTPDERRYFDESIKYLNQVLRAAAQYTRVTYVDIETALEGERLCDANETAMNSLRPGNDIAPIAFINSLKVIGAESFHPTPRGHERIAQKIKNELEHFWSDPYCTTCSFNNNMLDASVYWSNPSSSGQEIAQAARRFMYINELQAHVAQRFLFPAGTFRAGTTVRMIMHSEPVEVGRFTASEDGSLEGEAMIPDVPNGYHSIHVIGENAGGRKVDLYETVYVGNTEMVTPKVGNAAASTVSSVIKAPTQKARPASVSVESKGESLVAQATPKVLGAIDTLQTKNPRVGQIPPHPPLTVVGIITVGGMCLALVLWIIWIQRGGKNG